MRLVGSLLALAALAATVALPRSARADEEASPTGKGIAGGILLGAELVLVIEAAADVEPAWAYVVGGLAGAAAGGVGGYFIEEEGEPKLPLLMLAGGMALAIPTTVAVLSATAYEPPLEYVEDEPPADEPVADPPRPVGASPTSRTSASRTSATRSSARRKVTARSRPVAAARSLPSLIGVEPARVTLSIPAVEFRDVYTRAEVATFGLTQATEVRIPVLNVLF
jgi:hypothetical protein